MMVTAKTGNEIIIEPAYLRSLLQQIVPSNIFQLLSWNCSPLGENKEESSVYRVLCTVLINSGSMQNYSLIIRINFIMYRSKKV
jgi:hypothetical protein